MGPRIRDRMALVTVIVVLFLAWRPAGAQQGVQGFFAGTSADGGILLAHSHHDLSASTVVHLAGVVVPGRALSSFNKYCSKVLGGNLLMVQVHQQQGRVGFISGVLAEITILAGSRRINFNKQVLVDGYGMLAREDRRFASWEKYENTGRGRGVGIWSLGAPTWPIPEIPRAPVAEAGAGSDRERVISQYGLPDHSNRVTVPDRYSFRSYHFYITDFYMREGLVFIYRDGILVNKQTAGGR